MKLSKKGQQKLAKKRKALESGLVKFELDDFEGAVTLTVEEAKQAHQCVMIEIANLVNDLGPSELIHGLEVLSEKLRERIEQAEEK